MSSISSLPSNRIRSDSPFDDLQHSTPADSLPLRSTGVSLYRLTQVLARIPVSRSAWFSGVRSGRYPRGRSLGPRTTVWRSDEIDQLIDSINGRTGEA